MIVSSVPLACSMNWRSTHAARNPPINIKMNMVITVHRATEEKAEIWKAVGREG